jgi:signal transduction histidine kinase
VSWEKSEPEILAQPAWGVHALAMRLRWPDWVVVAVCTVAQLSSLQPGNADHDVAAAGSLAAVAALFGGIVLVWRRRAPLRVLGGATAAYVVQAAAAGPVVPAAVLAGCYAAARYASLIRGVVAGLLAVAVVVGTVVLVGPAALAATYAVPLLLAVLVGVVVAARQTRIEATMASVVVEERLRIARDLHDVVGHGMAAITVQAGAARMALAAGADATVRRALLDIEQAGRGVLREVRWLVGVLRDRPEHRTMSDLAALADAGRTAGFAVQLRMDGNLAAVPPQIVETAYRIVQEGLTNAFRYSGCEQVWVHVEADDVVEVTVLDDGAGAPAVDGHGIRGMRERAAAVGGEMYAGPRNDAPGWQVRATLPVRKDRR